MEEQRYNFLNIQGKTLELRGSSELAHYTTSRLWGVRRNSSLVPVTSKPGCHLYSKLMAVGGASTALFLNTFPKKMCVGRQGSFSSPYSSACSLCRLCPGSRSSLYSLFLVASSWLHVGELESPDLTQCLHKYVASTGPSIGERQGWAHSTEQI